MERAAGRLELCAARCEIDCVVAVAPVGRTTARGHEAALSQEPEVVRDEVLWRVDALGQLPHRAVALDQLLEQLPPQGMAQQVHDLRRVPGGTSRRNARHVRDSTRSAT